MVASGGTDPVRVVEQVLKQAELPPGVATEAVASAYLQFSEDAGEPERPSSVGQAIADHLRTGTLRERGQTIVRVHTPEASDALAHQGRTLVEIVTDDRPFVVDTVSLTLTKQGYAIFELWHPQFTADRDTDGRLITLTPNGHPHAVPGQAAESWVLVEVTPPLGESVSAANTALEAALTSSLTDLEMAVDDFNAMCQRMAETIAQVRFTPLPVPGDERREALDLLTWFAEGNFTFLGYEEFGVDGEEYTPVPGTGLGILRTDRGPHRFDATARPNEPHRLLVLTKDSARATVHRPSWLDYVGVRQFDSAGRIVGERRFLGLFGSSAYTESVWAIPVLRAKAEAIMARSGYDPASHSGAQLKAILGTYPRDELFHASADELFPVIDEVSRLRERRQVRLFLRVGHWGRFVAASVYFPRDRYNTEVRHRMEKVLTDAFGAESIEYQARVSESVLARLFFVLKIPDGAVAPAVDVADLERRLNAATHHWDDDFVDIVGDLSTEKRGIDFPDAYKDQYPASEGVADLMLFNQISAPGDMRFSVHPPTDPADPSDVRVKVLRVGAAMSLSEVMPHLSSLGVRVVDERPYPVLLRGQEASVYDFGLRWPGTVDARDPASFRRFTAAFEASYRGLCEVDQLNALVTSTGLSWREVAVLRAVSRYLMQLGTPFSQAYIAQALTANPQIASSLVALFRARFDPECDADRDTTVTELDDGIVAALDAVSSLDQDRIIRQFLSVLRACVRTTWFVAPDDPDQVTAFKLVPARIDTAPEPRPAHEIYVYSPRVEGVHLRFGAVARGGLRWSDRPEDFRTEILDLAKAQMVKNTVIVPVGAKGGFFARRLPNPASDRAAWQAEGVAAYQLFVGALLGVTDNIVDHEVVAPERVVRYDGDDPYLVVAADKGTATFSDIANQIAVDRGFWLGDAFASGGSAGYDHKAMGITARGAWESVKRHFREMGVDCQTTDFTCVGIGDMAGDVFGNGMLLSRHTRLVAAFNHVHIFLDPDPDAEASFAERERLFRLPRSSWADYDVSLISTGGGVHSRQAKRIAITPEVRRALGLPDETTAMTPNELISAILKAPVDLLWNGGIGTYVRGSGESDALVGDRANDAVRITGRDVRAECAGEGGNLGWTQQGRIEYAAAGGRINTDFIDNSAGVDTSDHEVNIKILLAAEIAAGRLTMAERDALLPEMTDEVAALVLSHNVDQNAALADAARDAVASAGVHELWMTKLEQAGYLDRRLATLPDTAEMAERIRTGRGLTGPELCMLMAWTKIWLEDEILASELPDDPFLADRLVQYFPQQLRDRYREQIPGHRLHREIITTVAVNRFVNSQGLLAYQRHSEESGASADEVIRAQLAARSIVGAGRFEVQAERASMPASVRLDLRSEMRALVDRATRWLLRQSRARDIQQTIDDYAPGVAAVTEALPGLLPPALLERHKQAMHGFVTAGVPETLARQAALARWSHWALPIVDIARRTGREPLDVAAVWVRFAELLGLRRLLDTIEALPRRTRWDILARVALRDELAGLQEHLVEGALTEQPGETASDTEDAWTQRRPDWRRAAENVHAATDADPDLARLSVALRTLRTLTVADRA